MRDVDVRPMTQTEFERWQLAIAEDYADEQVAAGLWTAEGSVVRALEENARRLPLGLDTPRMLVLQAVTAGGESVGRAWVGLDHPHGIVDTAFLYDIEIVEDRRGSGYGAALLHAVEGEVRDAGVGALELNVFGRNLAAIRTYLSSGYTVTTQQMRKDL